MTREIQIEELIANPDDLVVDAMKKIDNNALGILFVVEDNAKLIGAITDGDIRRWIINTGDLSACVERIMNKSPKYLHYSEINDAKELLQEKKIHIIPIVDDDCRIIDIISDDVTDVRRKSEDDMSAVPVVIMAGGKGTRLQPYTSVLPKPLIPIGDVPIAQRIIDRFAACGINNFYLTINYKSGIIRAFFDDLRPNYSVKFVEENMPLGTAGSIKLITDEIAVPFIVSNCDILINCDYSQVYDYHIKSGNALTAVAAVKNISIPYGVFVTGENGLVESIKEKPRESYLVNTGMYILNPEVLGYIPDNKFFHMTDLIYELIKNELPVGMFPISEESFLDMGQFAEMEAMNVSLGFE